MNERELTKDEMSDKEKYVKGMKSAKKDFKKRYGDDAESVMYATATKMAKEGLNETEENSVSDKKENVQAEERQENLNWLEDIKRLSGLENTYENSVDAMKEYKVDESEEKTEEVIAEGQSPAQKAAFQKMLDAKKGKKSDDDVEEQVEEASGVRADTKGKVDKSEKKHYHCKLTKDDKTKGVRMVADEGESEADVKARCKRDNMGWELQSMRKLDESLAEGAIDYDQVLDAIAALYGPDIYDSDAMGDLADDLEKVNPSPKELDFIIQNKKLPKRLQGMKFTNSDDIQFGEGEKKDHNGDGKIDSNDYLAARDKAIKAAIAKKKGDVEEGLAELADLVALAGLEGKVELDELANEPGQGTEETATYSVSDVIDQGNDLHAKSKQHADKAKLGDNPMATEEVDVVENKLWKAYQAELEGVKK